MFSALCVKTMSCSLMLFSDSELCMHITQQSVPMKGLHTERCWLSMDTSRIGPLPGSQHK
jgi:hypothetical protein